ncbi:MAG: hypothetical protein RMJ98_19025 [Myxococcales bacterium]|nr:hypothetical protein [Polyangiaceae bacterium]MDW8251395.1 hypothetical protein [Myxococcales bacterium]
MEHGGRLYRVDLLDDVLGSPLPKELWSLAGGFQRRVFSLAMAGLDSHAFELQEGIDVADCEVTCPPAWWLPPCGQHAALWELRPGASLALPLNGHGLLGHEARGHRPEGDSVEVTPCIGLILSEDLRLPSPAEVYAALSWMSLGLAWSDPVVMEEAERHGLGPGPGRGVGTHLGPWLQPATEGSVEVRLHGIVGGPKDIQVEVDLGRVASLMCRVSGSGELRAGDVILLPAPVLLEAKVGVWVEVESVALGKLRGRLGLSVSRRVSFSSRKGGGARIQGKQVRGAAPPAWRPFPSPRRHPGSPARAVPGAWA